MANVNKLMYIFQQKIHLSIIIINIIIIKYLYSAYTFQC